MKIAKSIGEVRSAVREACASGKRIGFVPTMGFLHEGHLSLIEISRGKSEFQVMSIFVNKLQFNDKNDFANYPKDLERDMAMAERIGVDLLFIPDDNEMYRNPLTSVEVELL